ncbi:RING-H2 finger protein ATL77 [Spatholobus suberectus]|nr:RING-H2 finger protein ATL77 [Spatholobus suberectus]
MDTLPRFHGAHRSVTVHATVRRFQNVVVASFSNSSRCRRTGTPRYSVGTTTWSSTIKPAKFSATSSYSLSSSSPSSSSSPRSSSTRPICRLLPVVRLRLDADAINQAPPRPNRAAEGTECCICLGAFVDGQKLKVLPGCDHSFHRECINKWLANHFNCPLCRASLKLDSSFPGILIQEPPVRTSLPV